MKYLILPLLIFAFFDLSAKKVPLPQLPPIKNYRFHKGLKMVSLTPDFSLQYANKNYYNSNIQLLPGFEYFWVNNFSSGLKLGPDFHMRQSGAEHHFHFGSTEELFVRKYFPIGHKRYNKAIFSSLGINHSIRWNHYHLANATSHSKDIETHIKPFTEIGLSYLATNKILLNAAIRANFRYDGNGKNYNHHPDFEMNYVFGVNYLLN